MSFDLLSPSWYRVADLRPRLRSHVRIHRHHYRGELWYVLEDRVSRRMHRFNPVAYYLIAGDRAEATLASAKSWLVRNNAAVMGVLLLVFGVKLLAEGAQGLLG